MKYEKSDYISMKKVKMEVYYELMKRGINVIPYHKIEEYHFDMVIVVGEEIIAIIQFKNNGKLGPDHYFVHHLKGNTKIVKCTTPSMVRKTVQEIEGLIEQFPRTHI
jgi:hypothetical protein